MRTRPALLAVAALGALVLTAGCRSTAAEGTAGPVIHPSAGVLSPPATSAPATTAPADGPTTTPPAGPTGAPTTAHNPPPITECNRAAGLDITPGGTDAAAGHRRLVLVFTNTSGRTCILIGYPGVDALDIGRHTAAHAARTLRGYAGGLPAGHSITAVTLSPGESASAVVEAEAFGPDGGSCTAYAGLLVTAPDDTVSVRVAWAGTDACGGLQVHPVVPGSDG